MFHLRAPWKNLVVAGKFHHHDMAPGLLPWPNSTEAISAMIRLGQQIGGCYPPGRIVINLWLKGSRVL
jgi:hypothetical protein